MSTMHFSLKNVKRTSKNLRNIQCCRFTIPESKIFHKKNMCKLKPSVQSSSQNINFVKTTTNYIKLDIEPLLQCSILNEI